MALVIDINSLPAGMTRREVAVMAGLAKQSRGRLSGDANRMLDKLEADGYVFGTPAASVEKTETVKPLISQKEIDLLAFREWCVDNSIPVPEKRIPTAVLNRYVTEVPDFKRRDVEVKPDRPSGGKIELKPLPPYDAKAARKWAIAEKLEGVPERGRLPRWIAERFIAAHAEAGTDVPKAEPENANSFGPTPAQINFAERWRGIDLDGSVIERSVKDVSADNNVSIGWSRLPVYAWSQVDTDKMIELEPVNA